MENEKIGNQQIRKPNEKAKELMRKGFIEYFTQEKGLTLEEAEHKFVIFNQSKVL